MSCLRTDEIHDYLENGPDASGAGHIEAHAADCPACREALDARRRILQAALSLDPIAVPDGFAAGVIAHLDLVEEASLPRLSLRGWLAATVAGSATFAAALIGLALLSGRNLGAYLFHLSDGLLGYIQGAAAATVKLAKYALVFLKIAREFAGALLEVVKRATAFIGPEVQAACFVTALLVLTAGAVLWKRRQLTLENRHDQ
jgi:hypothetical protein